MKKSIHFLLAIVFAFSTLSTFSQIDAALNKLPKDDAVITGTLKNGLTYYIRQNEKPENRVSFRMALKAGSILEDDDQQGIAHFLEHMAFNGTEDFSKNDLIGFLEQSGVNFGADLNAYTSFDETVYMFQMPSDRQGLIDSAFMVLENWAFKLSLTEKDIDSERGVVHEEWRLGLGAQDRMMKQYIPIIFKDSRYAERLPIGKMSVIDSCDYDVVRRFYRDWYRPDLMAIVVVGDIDPVYAEEQIKKHFGKMKGPKVKKERIEYTIPENNVPLVAIATDKEATNTMAMIIKKLPKFKVENNDNYRTMLKMDLFIAMLNERLFEITQDPEAPFTYSGSDYGGFLAQSLDAFTMFSMVKDNMINEAIATMITENKRIKKYGFTQPELDRQKAATLSNFEKALEEKDKTESRNYVNEYVSNFLNHEPFPGIEYEAALVAQEIPTITLDEVNQMSYFIGKLNNLVIMITAPDKEEVVIPAEEEILAVIAEVGETAIEAYAEETVKETLITEDLPAGKVAEVSLNEDFDVTTLNLDNGVSVILKPTDFKNDEILMSAYGFGGTSLASDKDFISASYAGQIMSMSGVGDLDNIELKKFLTGKNVNVDVEIGTLSQGLSGRSVKKDLETMFQLIYLNFTEPRKDTTAIKTFKSMMQSQFKFMLANPQAVFYDTLYKLATQNDPRTIIIPTEDQINSVNLDVAYDFYKDRFINANGFTFVFVGSFDVDELTPLITKYLGSLPATTSTETWNDVSPKFPDGITNAIAKKGTEPKSTVAIMMDHSFDWNITSRMEMTLLMKILNIRMRESMREEQGGVYGVSARPTISKYPKEEVNIMINWGCAPENVGQLVKTVFAEMDTLQMSGPTEVNLGKAKETTIRDYQSNFEKNKYWLSKIRSTYYNGGELKSLEQLTETIKNISSTDLQNMAKKYFTNDHYLKVVLMPEESE